MQEKISVTIPCYRSGWSMDRCIRAIREQTVPVHEIIVIDDHGECPKDDGIVIAQAHQCKVFTNSKNAGLAACMNIALHKCEGDYLAKVDSDIELAPNWVEECLREFDVPDSGIAGVGGRVLELHQQSVADRWRTTFMRQHYGQKRMNPPGLFGADQFFSVEAVKKVGGWDAKYKTNFEDMDLSNRLTAAKYKLVYTPTALALHLRQDTLRSVLKNFWMWYHPLPHAQGMYGSIDRAKTLISRNLALAQERFIACYAEGGYEMSYPSFMLFPILCMWDLEKVRLESEDLNVSSIVIHTQNAIANSMIDQMDSLGWDKKFMNAFRADLNVSGPCRVTPLIGECDKDYIADFISFPFVSMMDSTHKYILEVSQRMTALDN